jgi:hypothetical protein
MGVVDLESYKIDLEETGQITMISVIGQRLLTFVVYWGTQN